MSDHIPRLDVQVASAPVPGLIRPGIESALAGRALGGGPEAAIAQAVASAVQNTRPAGQSGSTAGEGGSPC